MSLSEEEIIWLEELFDTYYDKLHSFLYARTLNSTLAEDITSQTFLKVAEKLKTYNKDKGALSTWIFTIALNDLRSYYRIQKETVLDDLLEVPSPKDIEDDYVQEETKQRLSDLLRDLNAREQTIVTLKYNGELSNREIGAILEITESNVGTILNRVIKKLKKVFNECDETANYAYKSQEGKL